MANQTKWRSIEDFDMYRHVEQLCDDLWQTVIKWDVFAKDTIGKQ